MNILVTGSTGMIGSALVSLLSSGQHTVSRLVRHTPKPGAAEVQWDPVAGSIDSPGLEEFDAVVHLAGENIAQGRWTHAKKERIRNSRIQGTRILSEALSTLAQAPQTMVCASAIGYYGDRGEESLRETSGPGSGFLSDVCREWEAAARPAAGKRTRVVHLRIGVVLSSKGGALAKMLLPFRLGIGGKIGSGRQFMSWISLDDLLRVIQHALTTKSISGPVNAVSPHPVTNLEFTRTLGKVLSRPTIFPVPSFGARLAFGKMADDLLLASTRVDPTLLIASGYQFVHPTLEEALRHVLRN